jgi:hypothetical protein
MMSAPSAWQIALGKAAASRTPDEFRDVLLSIARSAKQ